MTVCGRLTRDPARRAREPDPMRQAHPMQRRHLPHLPQHATTTPEDIMTSSHATDNRRVDATDNRRAAALVVCYLDGNAEGADVIVEEANRSDRTTELLSAVLAIMDGTLTELRTPVGIRAVKNHLRHLAFIEDGQPAATP